MGGGGGCIENIPLHINPEPDLMSDKANLVFNVVFVNYCSKTLKKEENIMTFPQLFVKP